MIHYENKSQKSVKNRLRCHRSGIVLKLKIAKIDGRSENI